MADNKKSVSYDLLDLELPESLPETVKSLIADKLKNIPTNIAGIYLITNTSTQQVYIGSSKHIHNRLKKHLQDLFNSKHHSYKLQQSFKAHGVSPFKFLILEEVSDLVKLIETEQKWIDTYRAKAARKMMNINKRADGADYLKRKKRATKKT